MDTDGCSLSVAEMSPSMRASGARRRVAKEAARMTARDDSSTAGSAFGEPGQASPANLAEHCSQDTSGDSCLTWRYSTKHYAAKYRPVECDYLAWALVQVPYYGPLSCLRMVLIKE